MEDELHIEISSESKSDTKLNVQERGHAAVVDEPADLGGDDAGPNPLEYMFTGLAGCMNVTIHHVADEKDVEVESLRIDVTGDIDLEKFMTGSGSRAGFEEITVKIDLETDADPEVERQLVRDAEERCPVSDNLRNGTSISVHE